MLAVFASLLSLGAVAHWTDPLACPHGRVICPGTYPVREAEEASIAILDSGEGSFAARMESLKSARRSIRVQALIIYGHESSEVLLREIIRKKKEENLDVRVIVDLIYAGESKALGLLLHDLEVAGIEVVGFDPLGAGPSPNVALLHDGFRLNKRLHEKLWIIDGEDTGNGVAILGGLNVANEYFRVGPDPKRIWRDQDVLVKGRILEDLTRSFDENYDDLTRRYRTVDEVRERRRERMARRNAKLHEKGKREIPQDPRTLSDIEEILDNPPEYRILPARATYLRQRPRERETYITEMYLRMIDEAAEEIVLSNSLFIPDKPLMAALIAASRRGVKVILHTNDHEGNVFMPLQTLLFRPNYAPLMRAGVRIFEWNGDQTGQYVLHAKWMVVDRKVSLVGSYNIDPRSRRLNSENAIVFESEELALDLLKLFARDLSTSLEVSFDQASRWERIEGFGEFWAKKFLGVVRGWF